MEGQFREWQRGNLAVNASRFADAVPNAEQAADRIFSPNYIDGVLNEIGRVHAFDVCASTPEPFYEDARWQFMLAHSILAPDSCRVMLGANMNIVQQTSKDDPVCVILRVRRDSVHVRVSGVTCSYACM